MLQAAQGGNPSADLQHHLQAAPRVFHANRSILANHQVCVKDRLTFFHAVVTAVACFTAGHRKIFKQELAALDVAHRKLLRRVVGDMWEAHIFFMYRQLFSPVPFMGHLRAYRFHSFTLGASPRRRHQKHGRKFVYDTHWNLAQYFATRPRHRWVKRLWLGNHRGTDALVAQNFVGVERVQKSWVIPESA